MKQHRAGNTVLAILYGLNGLSWSLYTWLNLVLAGLTAYMLWEANRRSLNEFLFTALLVVVILSVWVLVGFFVYYRPYRRQDPYTMRQGITAIGIVVATLATAVGVLNMILRLSLIPTAIALAVAFVCFIVLGLAYNIRSR